MDDRTWAQIAIQLGMINPGLVEEFFKTKAELGHQKSLPQSLKELGLIHDGDIADVERLVPIRLGGTPENDFQRAAMEYAQKCVNTGLISEEQATESIRDLVIEGERRTMRELLLERRFVSEEQLDPLEPKPASAAPPTSPEFEPIDLADFESEPSPSAGVVGATPVPAPPKAPSKPVSEELKPIDPSEVEALRPSKPAPPPSAAPVPIAPETKPGKKKMRCVKCKLTLEVITRSGKPPVCPKCKMQLEELGFSPQLPAKATYATVRLKAADIQKAAAAAPPAAAKAAYTCMICDEKFNAAPDPGGRVTCPACGASFDPR